MSRHEFPDGEREGWADGCMSRHGLGYGQKGTCLGMDRFLEGEKGMSRRVHV